MISKAYFVAIINIALPPFWRWAQCLWPGGFSVPTSIFPLNPKQRVAAWKFHSSKRVRNVLSVFFFKLEHLFFVMKIMKTDLLMKMLSKVLQSTTAWNLQDNQRTMQSPIVQEMPYCHSKDTGRFLRNFHTPLLWFGHTFFENIWNQLNSWWSYSLQETKSQWELLWYRK